MKFSLIVALVASVSTIKVSGPAEAYKGRADNLAAGLKVVEE